MDRLDFERDLNLRQLEAVRHVEGPLLVLAGAGSGKTRVITYRIAHLIGQAGIRPDRILAVTFTNKAAGEMKRRVGALLGRDPAPRTPDSQPAGNVWVSTFHSTCARILRSHADLLGYPRDFLIYDDDDSRALAKRVLREMEVEERALTPQGLAAHIDRAKNRGLDPAAAMEADPDPLRGEGPALSRAEGYSLYQRRLKESGAMDFGDLLLNVVTLWKQERGVLDAWRRRFQFVLVDEFQDTNRVQMAFLLMLTGETKNICVVGDDDQSIYRWRGAEVGNILSFERHFPGAKVVRLEQNYRSTQVILDAANAVVANNEGRHEKRLWTDRAGGAPVTVYRAPDDRGEASYVAGEISRRRLMHKAHMSAFSVFVRTGAQTRVLEESFRDHDIPYELVGGVRFYERREVKDVLAYLRLCVNTKSDVDFERVVNCPPRGIGAATVARVRAAAAHGGVSMFEAASQAGGKLPAFVELVRSLGRMALEKRASDLAREVLKTSGYGEMLKGSHDPDGPDRLANIEELIAGMEEFEENAGGTEGTILAFLERAALTSEVDRYSGEGGKVALMTLHAAKGLEFRCVFITGCEEGVFPHAFSLGDTEELEEERRLMYVGMTRAMEGLFITHASRRRWQGQYRDQTPSRFIAEIPGARRLASRDAAPPALHHADDGRAAGYLRVPDEGGRVARRRRAERGDGTRVEYEDEAFPFDPGRARAAPDGFFAGGEAAGAPVSGRKVRHGLFGVGTVKAADGEGERRKLTVLFPGVGLKKILERYVEWVK